MPFHFQAKLKFCCDYMTNFSTGTMLKLGWENLQESVLHSQHKRCPSPSSYIVFQPRLKFECDYMRFFSQFDLADGYQDFRETKGLEDFRLSGLSRNKPQVTKLGKTAGVLQLEVASLSFTLVSFVFYLAQTYKFQTCFT